MGKLITAALVAVIAIEPLRFNENRHMPGARVEGLTPEQADSLIAMGHARPADEEGGETDAERAAAEQAAADQAAADQAAADQAAAVQTVPAKTAPAKKK